jgi:TonB family protein
MHTGGGRAVILAAVVLATGVGCARGDSQPARGPFSHRAPSPDEMPALASTELPFRYPAALYARKVQGNVTLRLFVNGDGGVVADSTRVEEPSGYAALDSAAVAGSSELHFSPARLHGEPLPTSILFPVYFRHPEARPLPGDTILTLAAHGDTPTASAPREREER